MRKLNICYEFEVPHAEASAELPVEPLPLPVVSAAEYVSSDPKWSAGPTVPPKRDEALSSVEASDGKVTRVRDQDLIHHPYSSVGRLFADDGKTTWASSGAAVGPRLILTAGHCVHPGRGGNVRNSIRFIPSCPINKETYRIVRVWVDSAWVEHGAFYGDYAICLTETPMNLPTGYWGIVTELGDSSYGWTTWGYPASGRFAGNEHQWIDGGPQTFDPWRNGRLIFREVGLDHIDFTAGSSGGPWHRNGAPENHAGGRVILPGARHGRPGRPFLANGLNSFIYRHAPGVMISPFFGPDAGDFFQEAIGRAP